MKKKVWAMLMALVMMVGAVGILSTSVEAKKKKKDVMPAKLYKAVKGSDWTTGGSWGIDYKITISKKRITWENKKNKKDKIIYKIVSVKKLKKNKYVINVKYNSYKQSYVAKIKNGKVKLLDYYSKYNGKGIYSGSSSLWRK